MSKKKRGKGAWHKTSMRGCRPGCVNIHLPVVYRINDKGEYENRHVWKAGDEWNESEGEARS